MNRIAIGIIAALVIALGGMAWFLKRTIAEQAETEMALEQTVTAMAEYAANVESEVAAYTMALDTLQEEYQNARDERGRLAARLSEVDVSRLAVDDPVDLERRINRATRRMLDEIAAATAPGDSRNADVAETGARGDVTG